MTFGSEGKGRLFRVSTTAELMCSLMAFYGRCGESGGKEYDGRFDALCGQKVGENALERHDGRWNALGGSGENGFDGKCYGKSWDLRSVEAAYVLKGVSMTMV